jgi:hypothetical protein
MAPEENKSCTNKVTQLKYSYWTNAHQLSKVIIGGKESIKEELQTCAMIWPDGYFATKAKFSIAQGWGPAY